MNNHASNSSSQTKISAASLQNSLFKKELNGCFLSRKHKAPFIPSFRVSKTIQTGVVGNNLVQILPLPTCTIRRRRCLSATTHTFDVSRYEISLFEKMIHLGGGTKKQCFSSLLSEGFFFFF